MMRVHRKDYAWEALALPSKTGGGLMRLEGYISRSGVFSYTQPDGTVIREWRPPDEVADATSVDSARMAPATLDHPAEEVTLANFDKLAVGYLGDDVRVEMLWAAEGPSSPDKTPPPNVKLRAKITIKDTALIAKLEAKELRELSCGYTADLEMTPGRTPDGEDYDAIQRRIRYDHVAFVDMGRQGPGIAVRLDHLVRLTPQPQPQPQPADPAQETTMKKLTLDGVSYDAPEQTIEAVQAHQRKSEQALAQVVTNLDSEKAKVVDLNKKLAEAEEKADSAAKGQKAAEKAAADEKARIGAGVKARITLERAAINVMGETAFGEAKLGDADDIDVRAAVVRHANPDLNLDERVGLAKKGDAGAAAYIESRFDVVVECSRSDDGDDDETPAKGDRADGAGGLRKKSSTGVAVTDSSDARAASIAQRADAWKKPPANL